MSELKCCDLCGAFHTCKDKKECCPECEYFDPVENTCLAIFEKKRRKSATLDIEDNFEEEEEVDPDTFLFEDDEDEEEEIEEGEDLEDGLDFDDDEW